MSTPSDADRRRRLAEVFGEEETQTSDDQADPREESSSDEWLRAQVPPHHG